MPSDNLNIPLVSTSQNQKELTINDAINAIDNALNSSLNITITVDRTLTTDEFTRNVIFNLTGTPAGAFNLVIPATERLFAVRNNTGQTVTVKYSASGSFPISTGDAALIHSNGTDIVGLGGGTGGGATVFTDLTDVPSSYTGHSLKRVRVNTGETGLEFIIDSFLNLSDAPDTFTGSALYKVRVNAGGTALEFVEDVATSGTDLQARAGATRFVVPGTYADPSDADTTVNRNALEVTNSTSSDARALNAAITGMGSLTQLSGYVEVFYTVLPTGENIPLYLENFSGGESVFVLKVSADGSVGIARDEFFSTFATSATGVIVADTHHRIAVFQDKGTIGNTIKVVVDGTVVITTTASAAVTTEANLSYRVGAFSTTATVTGRYSRAAFWSGLLTEAEAIALTQDGDPQGFSPASAVLRAYWKLDDGTGTTAADTVGTVDLTLTGAGAGWGTIPVLTPPTTGTIVRVASSSATGDFATHENDLALKTDAGWTFLDPVEGWDVYDQTTNIETRWNGTAWAALPSFTGGTLTSALNEAPATTLASAGSLNIGAEAANTINITGTTTITALGTIADGATRRLVFAAALTLTHNATSLILPTGANITTAAGDVAEFVSLGAGNWKCIDYQRADGTALSGGGSFTGGTLTSALNEAPAVTIASAATVNIGAAAANTVKVTGTTTITAFDTIADGALRLIEFQGALTLTHNATSLILPTSANITTATGDTAEFRSLGAGNWKCVSYMRADGTALVGSGSFTGGTLTSALNEAPPTTLASGATTDIGAEAANTINISGTTTITSFGTIAAGAVRRLVFQGILTLTHNATSLILPTGANIVTAADDVAEFVSLGAGNWRCTDYRRASGAALSGGGSFTGGTLTSALNEAPITTLASASSIDIGAEAANTISISGTTTITALGTIASGAVRRLVFQGALTLTHNATSLILPTGANITTAAGDVAEFVSLGSGNWRCFNYQRASGAALSGGGAGAGWTEHFLWSHAVSGDTAFPIQTTGIVANEILVIINGVTKSASGSAQVHVSVDNGTTYYTTSGDYASLSNAGSETAATNFIGVPTASAAARTHWAHIMNNRNGDPVKIADTSTNGTGSGFSFKASTADIDAISVNSSAGGNATGGTIQVLVR